jgi:hypothetical protein
MSRARPAVLAFAAAVACALAGLVAVSATDDRDLAFTLGVRPTAVAAVVAPGERACQRPVDVAADARSVRFKVGTFGTPGPPLEVAVRAAAGPRAAGSVGAGYGDVTWQRARLDRELHEGERVEVCVRNRGERRAALYGGPALAARTSSAYVAGRAQATDIALVFERGESRSAFTLVPAALEHAALFRPGWLGVWLLWAAGFVLAVLVPLLLAAALRSAAATDAAPDRRPPDRP